MDRRRNKDQREGAERRKQGETVATERRTLERRAKVSRRRQIDPTTCERDYSDEEVEFMQALDAYKRTSGRMFPTCSEILEVIRDLGYIKRSSSETPSGEQPQVEPAPAEPVPAEPNLEGSSPALEPVEPGVA